MNTQSKFYFSNLDGFRFFCFLSVFFFHSFHSEYDYIKDSVAYQFIKNRLFANGNMGVNFFFVLSGFLITYLLIDEKKINGKIDIKKFLLRRILRIWPLFFFCVFFGFFIFPQLKLFMGQKPNETASIWYYLSFLNNFDKINKGIPDASILTVLWSVAVEEQFYLVWPILLYLFPIKKYYIIFASLIFSSWLFRAFNDDYILHENHTLSCIGDLAIGSLGAWLMIVHSKAKSFFINLKPFTIFSLYLSFFIIYFFRNELLLRNYWLRVFERSFIAVLIIAIILEQIYSKKSFLKLSKLKTVSSLGKITYGLYCLHFVGILITTNTTKKLGFNTHLWQVIFLETLLALIISIVLAKLSYKYFEAPFLKLKERYSYINQ